MGAARRNGLRCTSYSGRPVSPEELTQAANQAHLEFVSLARDSEFRDAVINAVHHARSEGTLPAFEANPDFLRAEILIGHTPHVLLVPREGELELSLLNQLVPLFQGPRQAFPNASSYGNALTQHVQTVISRSEVRSAASPWQLITQGEQIGQVTRWPDSQTIRNQQCRETLQELHENLFTHHPGSASGNDSENFSITYERLILPVLRQAHAASENNYDSLTGQSGALCSQTIRQLARQLPDLHNRIVGLINDHSGAEKALEWSRGLQATISSVVNRSNEVLVPNAAIRGN